jgi:hypothetical protein
VPLTAQLAAMFQLPPARLVQQIVAAGAGPYRQSAEQASKAASARLSLKVRWLCFMD